MATLFLKRDSKYFLAARPDNISLHGNNWIISMSEICPDYGLTGITLNSQCGRLPYNTGRSLPCIHVLKMYGSFCTCTACTLRSGITLRLDDQRFNVPASGLPNFHWTGQPTLNLTLQPAIHFGPGPDQSHHSQCFPPTQGPEYKWCAAQCVKFLSA